MPFSTAAASFYIPSSHTQGFKFPHILVVLVCLSPMTSDVWTSFHICTYISTKNLENFLVEFQAAIRKDNFRQ